jgi:hypothetical protein
MDKEAGQDQFTGQMADKIRAWLAHGGHRLTPQIEKRALELQSEQYLHPQEAIEQAMLEIESGLRAGDEHGHGTGSSSSQQLNSHSLFWSLAALLCFFCD